MTRKRNDMANRKEIGGKYIWMDLQCFYGVGLSQGLLAPAMMIFSKYER